MNHLSNKQNLVNRKTDTLSFLTHKYSIAILALLLSIATADNTGIQFLRSRTDHSLQHEPLCEKLNNIPEECRCTEPGNYHVVIHCMKPFNSTHFNDTIGMKLDLDICNDAGSSISLDVTEKNHNIDFPIEAIKAGEQKNIPIPGLSIMVPSVGSLGVDVTVLILGNPDTIMLQVGLNACLQAPRRQICASSIPGFNKMLPWYILNGTYSFGNACDSLVETVAVW